MKKRLVIVGGKGSAQIAMAIFEDMNLIKNEWIIEGYLSDIMNIGDYIGRYKIVGRTAEIEDYVAKGYYIHNALFYNAKEKYNRVKNFKQLNIPIEANATAVHPKAYINPDTKIGFGVAIAPFVSTSNAAPTIGNYVHIYSHTYLAHEAMINDYVTLTAHSIVGGRVKIDEGAHIGLNACLREDVRIGKYAIVGMGSVVLKDVKEFEIVAGNPAKQKGSLDHLTTKMLD